MASGEPSWRWYSRALAAYCVAAIEAGDRETTAARASRRTSFLRSTSGVSSVQSANGPHGQAALASMDRLHEVAFEPAQLGRQLRETKPLGAFIEDPRVRPGQRAAAGHSVSVPCRVPAVGGRGAELAGELAGEERPLGGLQVGGERRPRRVQAAAPEEGGPRWRAPPRARRRSPTARNRPAPRVWRVQPGGAEVRRLGARCPRRRTRRASGAADAYARGSRAAAPGRRGSASAVGLGADETVAFQAFEAADVASHQVRGRGRSGSRRPGLQLCEMSFGS